MAEGHLFNSIALVGRGGAVNQSTITILADDSFIRWKAHHGGSDITSNVCDMFGTQWVRWCTTWCIRLQMKATYDKAEKHCEKLEEKRKFDDSAPIERAYGRAKKEMEMVGHEKLVGERMENVCCHLFKRDQPLDKWICIPETLATSNYRPFVLASLDNSFYEKVQQDHGVQVLTATTDGRLVFIQPAMIKKSIKKVDEAGSTAAVRDQGKVCCDILQDEQEILQHEEAVAGGGVYISKRERVKKKRKRKMKNKSAVVEFYKRAWPIALRQWGLLEKEDGSRKRKRNNSKGQKQVHPVLMVLGLVLLNGEVSGTKNYKKLVHLLIQFLAFCFGIIGLWAAWKFHDGKGIDNFYSLHSWLGLACLSLFTIQWGAGFAAFWYPGVSRSSRASLMPWHVFFGVYIYVLAVAACATGLLEKAAFLQANNIISRYSAEAMLVNIFGVLIVFLGGFVILGVVSPPKAK